MQTFSFQVILLYNPISPWIVQKRKLKLQNHIGTTRDPYNFFHCEEKMLENNIVYRSIVDFKNEIPIENLFFYFFFMWCLK